MANVGIGVHATDESTVVVLRGEVDLASSELLRAVLRTCRGDVVVDLSEATLLDAASIGVLVTEQDRLAAHDGRLRLSGPTGIVERVLRVVGLERWIDAAPSPRVDAHRADGDHSSPRSDPPFDRPVRRHLPGGRSSPLTS